MIETSLGGNCSPLALRHAILLYSRGEHAVAQDGFVTVNPVHIVDDRPVIGPGQPASKAAVFAALDALVDRNEARSLFHPRVLGSGPDYLAWFSPPGKRNLAFNSQELGGKVGGDCVIPGLVFFLAESKWYVYAYKGTDRPGADTPLHVSPFYNVWDEGRICVGNIDLPKAGCAAAVEEWESAFFGTWFTHPNIPLKQMFAKGRDPVAFWKRNFKQEFATFPERLLKPTGFTLGARFARLVKGAD